MAGYLSENLIFLDLDAADRTAAFRAIVDGLAHQQAIEEPAAFLEELLEREAIEPTSIGRGVAFPHARTDLVKRPVVAFARPRHPIAFNDRPDDDVRLIFVMGTPKADTNLYLNMLARLCKMLRQPEFRTALLSVQTPREALRLIQEAELQAAATQPATKSVS